MEGDILCVIGFDKCFVAKIFFDIVVYFEMVMEILLWTS